MSKLPKRVWSGKKLVFSGKKAVREKDWQIGVYNPQFEEIDSWEVYDKKRENLDPEAPLDVYDSSTPEYIGTMEDGILATYTFYNYDQSVLKQGTCKDWETPIPPADPTRDSYWEYDYQFAWWNPAVWPIAKDTDYVASFNETKRLYTVYVSVNDSDYGSLDITELTVEAWTEILDSSLEPTLSPNQLMVWSTVVTATANAWYEFDYWTNWSQIVIWDQFPQAVFKVVTPVTMTPLNFTSSRNGSSVTFNNVSTSIGLEYSYDNSTWNDVVYSNAITLNKGEKIYVRNKDDQSTTFSTNFNKYIQIVCLWRISADGDISSLINPNGTDTLNNFCFYTLFKNSTGLIKAPALPFTTVPKEAYDGMFYWCKSLVEAPELPATTLGSDCYYEMFWGCSSLINIPYIPASDIPSSACVSMFRNCISLYISDQQDPGYVNEFRIPQSGEWTQIWSSFTGMFAWCNLGWSFSGTPTVNTTYYTNNTVGPITPQPVEDQLYTRCHCWEDQWIYYMTLSFLDNRWELIFGINYNMSDHSSWVDQWTSSQTTSIPTADLQTYIEPVFNLSNTNVYNNLWLNVIESNFWYNTDYVGRVSNQSLKDYINDVLEDITTDSSAIRTLLSTAWNLCISWFQNVSYWMGSLPDNGQQVWCNTDSPLDLWWCYLDGTNNIRARDDNWTIVVTVDPSSWYYNKKLAETLENYFEWLDLTNYGILCQWCTSNNGGNIDDSNIWRCIVVTYFYQDDNYATMITTLLNEYLPSWPKYGSDLIARGS